MRTRRAFILIGLLTCITCMLTNAAEYCLRPSNKEWTQAYSVVCCSTPAGWYGWKDDPGGYPDYLKKSFPLSKSYFNRILPFHQPSCKAGPECPFLGLRTAARDARGKSD